MVDNLCATELSFSLYMPSNGKHTRKGIRKGPCTNVEWHGNVCSTLVANGFYGTAQDYQPGIVNPELWAWIDSVPSHLHLHSHMSRWLGSAVQCSERECRCSCCTGRGNVSFRAGCCHSACACDTVRARAGNLWVACAARSRSRSRPGGHGRLAACS